MTTMARQPDWRLRGLDPTYREGGLRGGFTGMGAASTSGILDCLMELVWPTRCVICDAPGVLLCDHCRKNLGYIDAHKACPVCGSPFGQGQCCDCWARASEGTGDAPFDRCVSVGTFDGGFGRLVSIYKDRGEQRLAPILARLMHQAMPPEWPLAAQAICTIPSSSYARAKRGFDHMARVGVELSGLTGIPFSRLLATPSALDQRQLGRSARRRNMSHALDAAPGARIPPCVLLIDDVLTTGATMTAAARALKDNGAGTVLCLTLARV